MLLPRCSFCHALARRSSFSRASSSLAPASVSHPKTSRSRLFLAGLNPFLPSTSRNALCPSFVEVHLADWLTSIGAANVGSWPQITHLAAGHQHLLVGYRDQQDNEAVFALGRNEAGQLGIGYNSQEPTRGLVEGFSGDYVEEVKCGITSSYLKIDRSVIYACGNQYRGQLGIPPPVNTERPQQAFRTTASLVDCAQHSIKQLATGYEHALALTENGQLLGTGVNTDGQLGTSDDQDRHSFSPVTLPDQVVEEGISSIHAGGDTSALITNEGDLWTFGNSEYAQAFHGEKIDRVLVPKLVDWSLVGLPKIKSFIGGGSFSLLLNEKGEVYTAGLGAVGRVEGSLDCIRPTRIDGLEGIRSIHAGYGGAIVVDASDNIFVIGLNSEHGRLGIGSKANLSTFTKLDLPNLEDLGNFQIVTAALGSQTSYIVIQEDLDAI